MKKESMHASTQKTVDPREYAQSTLQQVKRENDSKDTIIDVLGRKYEVSEHNVSRAAEEIEYLEAENRKIRKENARLRWAISEMMVEQMEMERDEE